MLALYRGLTVAVGPLVGPLLRRRAAGGKEDPARLGERLGHADLPRPDGPLVWLHAASVGESLSVLGLIDRLLGARPGLALLMTSGTVTSARLLADRLPARAVHQFVPIDRPDAVRRFLDHWRPDLAIWVESELWPNLVGATQARGIATALIQGRMSARSFAKWRRARGLVAPLLEGFDLVLAQTETDAERLRALGAAPTVTGTLKYANPPLPANEAALAELRQAIGARPVWLAASTHPGEEGTVLRAHHAVAAENPGLLTIVAPRHPDRGAALADLATAAGLRVARRGAGEALRGDTQLYLADTMGEFGLFYRVADVVFVGGSLVPHGGQNLLEPIRLGCAVTHGPSMTNFAEVVADLARAGALREVADEAGLIEATRRLFAAPEERAALAAAQAGVAEAKAGVLEVVFEALEPLVPGESAKHARA